MANPWGAEPSREQPDWRACSTRSAEDGEDANLKIRHYKDLTQRHRVHGDEVALVQIRGGKSAQHVAPLLKSKAVSFLAGRGEARSMTP